MAEQSRLDAARGQRESIHEALAQNGPGAQSIVPKRTSESVRRLGSAASKAGILV